MVAGLLAERQAGELDFARAWRHASNRAAAEGITRPRDFILGDDADEDWLPFSTFFRFACEREWHGLERVDYAGLRAVIESPAPAPAGTPVPGSRRVVLLA